MEQVKNETLDAIRELKKLDEMYQEVQNDLASPRARIPKSRENTLVDMFKDSI